VFVVQGGSGASPDGGLCAAAGSGAIGLSGMCGARRRRGLQRWAQAFFLVPRPPRWGGGVSRDNGEAHLGGSARRAPRRCCTALGFAVSPLAEVWHLLEVWWVVDGYGGGVWVALQGKVRSWWAPASLVRALGLRLLFWLVMVQVAGSR
jgi:hypothetical protein